MYTSTVTQFEEPPKKATIDLTAPPTEAKAEQPLIWRNIIGIGILHTIAIYTFVTSAHEAKLWTWIFSK